MLLTELKWIVVASVVITPFGIIVMNMMTHDFELSLKCSLYGSFGSMIFCIVLCCLANFVDGKKY